MIAAIESAQKSISLCSYIFDNDPSGRDFAAALQRAVGRGVQVRVLVDAAGTRYSWPPINWKLKQAGIPHAKFLPASIFTPWRVATINLRNHRKSLVVDGQTGFTGGMNIRHGNVLAAKPKSPVQDLHFRVEGLSSHNCRKPSPMTGPSPRTRCSTVKSGFPRPGKTAAPSPV